MRLTTHEYCNLLREREGRKQARIAPVRPKSRKVARTAETGKAPAEPPKLAEAPPESIYFYIPGAVPGKPRQTQRDKWLKRPCVIRSREWANKARKYMRQVYGLPMMDTASVIVVKVYLPMPQSWPAKKKHEMQGTPHRQKPDGDNILKQVCDSLVRRDETIYRKEIYKEWAIEGQERTEVWIKP